MAKYYCDCGCGRCTVRAITWPLLLITVGILFALDQYGRYSFYQTWPVLLIVLGVTRMAAYLAPAHDGR
ncbi:MAG TPA: DUF5668 domain-containing protein [Bryobacterales bacterium]|nr:DUF5668 domain-containing protein [Bryobacterales bacterium]